jgi:dTDP-glucose 4,6-dehydratase/UDP-glucose 4-epimerase
MNVIIIGSEGFIGKHLFRHFTDTGHMVWGADIINGNSEIDKYFLIDPSVPEYKTLFDSVDFDLCINCSGASSVPESLKDPLKDYQMNTLNVFSILESIRLCRPGCRFINLSSAAVYGNPFSLPVKETFETNPLSPYGYHKLQAEQICREYYAIHGIGTCSLRIFSVYGAGLRKQIFWDLYKKIGEGKTFSMFGTGKESRDFIYVSDLVRAIEIVSKSSDFKADVINVANGQEIMIEKAVAHFTGLFGPQINYSFSGETRKGDPVNWLADIRKLRVLGYEPLISLEEGLQNYFNWLNRNSL